MAEIIDVKWLKRKGVEVQGRQYIPPHTTGREAIDIDELPELINLAMKEQFKRESIPKDKRPRFIAAWADKQVEEALKGRPVVAFHLYSRQFGNTSPDRERRPFRPSFKGWYQHPTDEQLLVEVSGQWMDNEIDFEIVSADITEANKWAVWFERFMLAWQFYFEEMGLNHFRFQKRMEDTHKTIGGEEYYSRKIRYEVRTELIYQRIARKIDEIHVRFDSGVALQEITDTESGNTDTSVWHNPTGADTE